MLIQPKHIYLIAGSVFLYLGTAALADTAHAIDWDEADVLETRVFHPGQASWEWALTPADHSSRAVERFRDEGRNCQYCHGDEIDDLGDEIASGEGAAPEPEPFDHRPGWIDLEVRAAHDGERMYWRLAWEAQDDGGDPMDPDHPARATVMFAQDNVREATRAGCWGACHDDLRGMESDTEDLDLTKYLAASRTEIGRSGGGENYRDDDELAGMIGDRQFFEYWQTLFSEGDEVDPISGYVLEARHEHDSHAVETELVEDGDRRVVVLSRAMDAKGDTQLPLASGTTYHGGFAVHEGGTDGRFHYVSLEYSFSIDSDDGDIAVMEQ